MPCKGVVALIVKLIVYLFELNIVWLTAYAALLIIHILHRVNMLYSPRVNFSMKCVHLDQPL